MGWACTVIQKIGWLKVQSILPVNQADRLNHDQAQLIERRSTDLTQAATGIHFRVSDHPVYFRLGLG